MAGTADRTVDEVDEFFDAAGDDWTWEDFVNWCDSDTPWIVLRDPPDADNDGQGEDK